MKSIICRLAFLAWFPIMACLMMIFLVLSIIGTICIDPFIWAFTGKCPIVEHLEYTFKPIKIPTKLL